MIDLDARLERGPLRVRSVWSGASPEGVVRRIDRRRRLFFVLDAVALLRTVTTGASTALAVTCVLLALVSGRLRNPLVDL